MLRRPPSAYQRFARPSRERERTSALLVGAACIASTSARFIPLMSRARRFFALGAAAAARVRGSATFGVMPSAADLVRGKQRDLGDLWPWVMLT